MPYMHKQDSDAHEKVRHILQNHVGYVLVTCRPANKSGKLEVELSFEGDPDLASFLVEGAIEHFEEHQLAEEA